jgi:hypothetical protein
MPTLFIIQTGTHLGVNKGAVNYARITDIITPRQTWRRSPHLRTMLQNTVIKKAHLGRARKEQENDFYKDRRRNEGQK